MKSALQCFRAGADKAAFGTPTGKVFGRSVLALALSCRFGTVLIGSPSWHSDKSPKVSTIQVFASRVVAPAAKRPYATVLRICFTG